MGWLIQCSGKCGKETWVPNIVDLIGSYCDDEGWFLCPCGRHGYIEKSFSLQEKGETWDLGLASPLGPVRRFNLAHPKLLILR